MCFYNIEGEGCREKLVCRYPLPEPDAHKVKMADDVVDLVSRLIFAFGMAGLLKLYLTFAPEVRYVAIEDVC